MAQPSNDTADEHRPLQVVEIQSGTAAAYAGHLLACLGASVTKVVTDGDSEDWISVLDVGKRIVADGGDGAVEALLADADVLVCQGDAATLDGGDLRMAQRRAEHPRLITAAVTPFGESGPHSGYHGVDLIALHAGGLGYGTPPRVVNPEHEHPLQIPGDAVSMLCGLVLACGVQHALLERDADGKGRHVELSAQEVVASCMFNYAGALADDGKEPGRLATDRPEARKPLIACADGLITVMANSPAHLRAWLELIAPDEEALRERVRDRASVAALRGSIDALADAWAASRSKFDAAEQAQARHIPAAPVLGPSEILRSPQLAAREFWRSPVVGSVERIPHHPFGPIAPGDSPRRSPARALPLSGTAPGPLSGLHVVDFGWIFAAPIASRILAALGADVVRIEHEGRPDPMRARPFAFRVVNGDKRSVVLDAKSDEGSRILRSLLREADVVVENFSPGTMDRLGLGWEALHALNPRLIMLSVSGMGQTGPYAHWVMFGQLAQAYAGLTALVGYERGSPRGIEDGGYWSDPVTGYAATAAVLAALRERAVTGRGRRVDVSLVEATAALFVQPLLLAQRGEIWGTRGNYHPAMAPHDVYRCAPLDGDRWLALAVRTDEEWQALCGVIDRPDLAADPAFSTLTGRQAQRQRLRDVIERWTREHLPEQATAALQAAGVPAAPSFSASGLLADGHLNARGFFTKEADAPGGIVMRALPSWRLHPAAHVHYGPAPRLGESSEALLAAMS